MNLNPERSSFSNGGELGRLIMCKPERRHVLVLTCEVGESRDHYGHLGNEEGEGLAEEDEVCVAVLMDVNGVVTWIVDRDMGKLTQ